MSELKVRVGRATDWGLQIEVGVSDPDAYYGLKFGYIATVRISEDHQDKRRVEVGFPSIGDLPPADAALRAEVYTKAAKMAGGIETLIKEFGETNQHIATLVKGTAEHDGELLGQPEEYIR